jgi:hypothetical protein
VTVSGQFSCPPAGSFVAVSGQFLVAADTRAKATAEQLASSPVAFGPVRMFAKDEVSN